MTQNKLNMFYTFNPFVNVAPGRKEISSLELHEYVLGKMNEGIAVFAYYNKDGEPRLAIGTLKPELLPVVDDKLQARMFALVEHVKACGSSKSEQPLDDLFIEAGKVHNLLIGLREDGSKPTPRAIPQNTQKYFDLGKKAWRSYDKERLMFLLDF